MPSGLSLSTAGSLSVGARLVFPASRPVRSRAVTAEQSGGWSASAPGQGTGDAGARPPRPAVAGGRWPPVQHRAVSRPEEGEPDDGGHGEGRDEGRKEESGTCRAPLGAVRHRRGCGSSADSRRFPHRSVHRARHACCAPCLAEVLVGRGGDGPHAGQVKDGRAVVLGAAGLGAPGAGDFEPGVGGGPGRLIAADRHPDGAGVGGAATMTKRVRRNPSPRASVVAKPTSRTGTPRSDRP